MKFFVILLLSCLVEPTDPANTQRLPFKANRMFLLRSVGLTRQDQPSNWEQVSP